MGFPRSYPQGANTCLSIMKHDFRVMLEHLVSTVFQKGSFRATCTHYSNKKEQTCIMKRIIQALLVAFVASFAIGCGDSAGDSGGFVSAGGDTGVATGNLVFNFTRPQISTPLETVNLRFDFSNASGVTVVSENRPFAAQIVFQNVSSNVVQVEITALDANGLPVASGTATVEITGGDQEVTVPLTRITLTTLTVVPTDVAVTVAGTQQLVLQGTFSNGGIFNLDASQATYTPANPGVATVSNAGLVTGVNAGTTTVAVAFTFQGTAVNATPVNVTVVGGPLNLTGPNTFDTTTGQLNGAATTAWDGTRLSLESFTLANGATFTITGNTAFQMMTTGDVTIDGAIDANGANGVDQPVNDGNAALGGAGGPGGFAGGRGGGFDVNDPNGADGQGPGAGGGGMGVTNNGFDDSAGGGGGGHSAAGTAGTTTGASTAGIAGVAYDSIPTTLQGGSGGGGGSLESDGVGISAADDGGAGGGGGGGVVSIQATNITVSATGAINCNGGAGGASTPAGGGGGGAGGSILLRATNAPTVNGALNVAGGAGGTTGANGNGGNGAAGRTDVGTI